jgi:hypothetical protein
MADTVPALKRFADELRARRAAEPNSMQWMDDPVLDRQAALAQTARLRFPHLFDPDYAQRLWRQMGGDDVPMLDTGGEDTEPIKRTRKRRPTLASVKRQAETARLDVAAYEFRPDGTIIAVVGSKPNAITANGEHDDVTPEDREQWR